MEWREEEEERDALTLNARATASRVYFDGQLRETQGVNSLS